MAVSTDAENSLAARSSISGSADRSSTTQQATIAIDLKDLDLFCTYFKKAADGAKALGSVKRRQEIIEIYQSGRTVWHRELRVRDLADLLLT